MSPIIRALVYGEGEKGKPATRFLVRHHVMWVGEVGPAVCLLRMVNGESMRVAEAAATFAKRLATEGVEPEGGA